ncbi:MAG: TetR/AcrR family transcriptional regulator [Bacteroidetes bacterium]|nr:MAG: TetR/AcrR family transcriptional regulator [Bacteroidota bacterium]REK06651.1 MAG: TetR/AcrR family transcriptional regulator [Bacteroidota bacterium]REK49816.1 MAG: TetR/AcrR family transcriptional regulator [Bacteroidota bacterium]
MEQVTDHSHLISERILNAARELFFRHGVNSVTMDDIAAKLGMSKKTIYKTCKDKQNLVTELVLSELKKQLEDMHGIRESSTNAIHELMQMMQYMGNKFQTMNPILFYDLQKYHSASWKHFKSFREKELTGFIEDNLKMGMKQNLYRSDLKVKILARLRLEQVELAFNPEAFPPDQFNVGEVQVTLLDHFLQGVVTLKGHKLVNKYKNIEEEEE